MVSNGGGQRCRGTLKGRGHFREFLASKHERNDNAFPADNDARARVAAKIRHQKDRRRRRRQKGKKANSAYPTLSPSPHAGLSQLKLALLSIQPIQP